MSLLSTALYALGGLAVVVGVRRLLRGTPMMPPLSTAYMARNHGGTRALSKIRLLVLHSTEGSSAHSTAQYFATTTVPASTHVVVGDTEGFRTLPDNVVPYGSGGGPSTNDSNLVGLHLEFSGHAAWSRAEWLQHDAMLRRGGAVIAAWAATYNLPLVMLGPQAVRDHIAQGIATHKTISDAYAVPGGHQDPGPNFPLDVVLAYARGA